jgi:hypothetical protein
MRQFGTTGKSLWPGKSVSRFLSFQSAKQLLQTSKEGAASLTSTPTTTISATVSGAFIRQSAVDLSQRRFLYLIQINPRIPVSDYK